MEYTRKKWQDEIVNGQGTVIQQGTPVNATNLNNLEIGTATAKNEINNLAAAVRETIHSGFSQLSAIDYAWMRANTNKIRLSGRNLAFVHGYKVEIPDQTVITLPDPPTTGDREDLVFLEVWLDQATDTEGAKVNSRIRVVAGVDFTKFPEGFHDGRLNSGVSSFNTLVSAQGGNSSPVILDWAASAVNRGLGLFSPQILRYNSATNMPQIAKNDIGVYIAGVGDQASKDLLKTADGEVYVIPMFRIKRRNATAYSANNPNGANLLGTPLAGWTWGTPSLTTGMARTVTVPESDYNRMATGQTYGLITAPEYRFTVLSKDGANRVTVVCSGTQTIGGTDTNTLYLVTRPDLLKADIIDVRDIFDLRHYVPLTGINPESLLEESFDKLLQGKLTTTKQKEMLKTYHGITKTPVDANTVFYASLDGTTTAEVGSAEVVSNPVYEPSPTGAGMRMKAAFRPTVALTGDFTVDMVMKFNNIANSASGVNVIMNYDYNNTANTNRFLVAVGTGGKMGLYIAGNRNEYPNGAIIPFVNGEWIHIRITRAGTVMKIYKNGALVISKDTGAAPSIENPLLYYWGNICDATVADLSISNIDRGAVFANLPADFISGYARIMPALTSQRRTHSDALTGQPTVAIAKGSGSGHSKGVTATQATPGQWASGDTIKIKGLEGEIITGLIDADTALAQILRNDGTTNVLYVGDNVSKFAVNDTIQLVRTDFTLASTRYITAIDATNKTITVEAAVDTSQLYYLFETTAVSSAPVAKHLSGGSLVTVAGGWSNLGTNEATFTLGTNAPLTNQDIQIEYVLVMAAGQGGISEVFTTTLAGEAKGKRLIPGTVAARMDYTGKVAGSVVENPNMARATANASLLVPGSGSEMAQSHYDAIMTLNEVTRAASTSVSDDIPQQFFSFSLVAETERKYGPIPSVDKVGWCRNNLSKITVNWYGYGMGPAGNKAYLAIWHISASAWESPVTHTASTPTILAYASTATTARIDANGFVHFVAYADPSDGVTPSTIYTDYICLDLELKYPLDYNMLVPENPRTDDGMANVLLIRKETKTIQSYFPASNNDGICVYGDYVPYQGLTQPLNGAVKTNMMGFFTTEGTGAPMSTSINRSQRPVPSIAMLPLDDFDYNYINTAIDLISNPSGVKTFLKVSNIIEDYSGVQTASYYFTSPGRVAGPNGSARNKRGMSGSVGMICATFDKLPTSTIKYLSGVYFLIAANCELYMVVVTSISGRIMADTSAGRAVDAFRLTNKPLIKEV